MDFSTQNHTRKRYYTCSQLYLFKNDIFTHLTLKSTFRPWRWPWIIQLISEMGGRFLWYLYKNKAINGFFHTKSHEKEVLHMLPALFVQKWYFHLLDPKIDFWSWRWPWIIQLISEMGGRFLWYLYDIRNSSIKDKVQIELIGKIYYITIWSYDFRTLKFIIFHWFRMQSFCYLTLDDLEN